MKILPLPHRVCDYACPLNGLEDIYEGQTGRRLPDYTLMDFSAIGFTYIRQKRAPAPRMVFWGSGMGKAQHEFLGPILGYRWTLTAGGSFERALRTAKEGIDRGVPAILGLLDMYHLPYFSKFYHRVHIPQHFVLMVGYDDERGVVFVHDTSREGIQTVPLTDLKPAWDVTVPGQGKKNSLAQVAFSSQLPELREAVAAMLRGRAELNLNPPVGFLGIRGMRKFAADFSHWPADLSAEGLRESLLHLVTFTCSVVPMPPQRMLPYPIDTPDPHQAVRDRFSARLASYAEEYGRPAWRQAADCFRESGEKIGLLTERATSALLGDASGLGSIPQIVSEVADCEERGYRCLLE